MTRVCFRLELRPERLDEYIQQHSSVPADVVAEIAASGRRNYSLFVTREAQLIGYYEIDDDAAAQAYLAASPVVTRWEAMIAEYFVEPDEPTEENTSVLTEVFHLEDQLPIAEASAP